MYNQTIAFFDYILKMRPHGEVEEIAFKRLTLSWFVAVDVVLILEFRWLQC